ncbi:Helix-turn-helix domain protein (modular protein) [Candidatus Sulfotelmatobacter sp. SbA7]|nr:Helix-turn-helix domain protein (modular protein) [Candidatus Sulfotelmatobacter sp. SbA7]
MKTAFEELMTGLDEVQAFLAGERKGFKVRVPEEVDVKSIRHKLNMTQSRFSDTFGFSLDAIKHWEGGRRTPEAPARTLLTVIDKNPAAVITALHPEALPEATTVKAARLRTMKRKTKRPFKARKAVAMAVKASGGNGTRSYPKNG